MHFEKITSLFFPNYSFDHLFYFFPNWKVFGFFVRKRSIQVEKRLFRETFFIIQQICRLWRFWKSSSFFRENHCFISINRNFVGFENSHYLSRILTQICYNSVKFTVRTVGPSGAINWKTALENVRVQRFERMIFPFNMYRWKMTVKNKAHVLEV